MQTSSSLFERELRRLVEERIAALVSSLERNQFETVAEFRYVMGAIAEMRGLDDLMDEARKRAEQRER